LPPSWPIVVELSGASVIIFQAVADCVLAKLDSINSASDFELGSVRVRPRLRVLETAKGFVSVEPLVMQLLVVLSQRAGRLVSRGDLFECGWGLSPVGDDSLNRVIARLRKALRQAAGDAVEIETTAGAGYVLRLSESGLLPSTVSDRTAIEHAIEAGRQSWRLGIPEPDHLRIEQLRQATRSDHTNAAAFGMLALLCRYAAEYGGPESTADHLAECEAAARRALALEPTQLEARVALATVAPLLGHWLHARTQLETVVGLERDCAPALHELAIIEMATGRVRQAKQLIDGLLAADPLAACFCYKSIWQHWSVGDLAGMDLAADRAMQLWPTHPAIWTARFWTFVHTNRAAAALAMVEDSARPVIPPPMLQFLTVVASAAVSGEGARVQQAVDASCEASRRGPAQAVAALLALGLFQRVDEAFDVANGYYARLGGTPVPLRRVPDEPSINDQHRRVTQPLFTPAGAGMRADPRFDDLCRRIGLHAYWEDSGCEPNFREMV
jgi:DNA-binding winged helix-turn-helix (wHTH) protein